MAYHSNYDINTLQPGEKDNGLSRTVDQEHPPAYDILFPSYQLDSNHQPQRFEPSAPTIRTIIHNSNERNRGTTATQNNSAWNAHVQFPVLEIHIRMGFVRKAYAILTAQMTIIVAFIALFTYETNVKLFNKAHPELICISSGILAMLAFVFFCSGNFRRRSPTNYIALILFTLSEGFFLGSATSLSSKDEVLIAAGICTAACFALTIFSLQTKWNFTFTGGFIIVFVVILLVFGIVAACLPAKVFTLMYASLGAFIFSVCLLCDTKLMLDGKNWYSPSPEDNIFAALNHHVDIIFVLSSIVLFFIGLLIYLICNRGDRG